MLSAETHIKGRSDMKKYEKARELKKHVVKIREDYTADLKSKAVGGIAPKGGGSSEQRGAIRSSE